MARRIHLGPLTEFCDRLGVALRSGVDIRRALETEIAHAPHGLRRHLIEIRTDVGRGMTFTDAMRARDGAFPPLVTEIVNIGEQTGKLDVALQRLAEHYRHVRRLRRLFLIAVAWPAARGTLAAVVVGLVIFVLGIVERITGQRSDILGFGLVGLPGLLAYLMILAGTFGGLVVLWKLLARASVTPYIWDALSRLPGIGPYLTADALARLCWTLSLADETGMDLIPAVETGLQSTGNHRYHSKATTVVRAIRRGDSLHEAFRQTGVFPDELLAAMEVGEQAGRTSEMLRNLSQQYQQQAQARSTVVTILGSVAIWIMVASVIIWLIFRIASFYFGTIQQFAV